MAGKNQFKYVFMMLCLRSSIPQNFNEAADDGQLKTFKKKNHRQILWCSGTECLNSTVQEMQRFMWEQIYEGFKQTLVLLVFHWLYSIQSPRRKIHGILLSSLWFTAVVKCCVIRWQRLKIKHTLPVKVWTRRTESEILSAFLKE